MNNNISKCLTGVLLCASVVPGAASADEDDVFSLTTSANWQYVDNVFYLPDGNEPTSFGPNTPRGDHSTTLSAGIVGEKRLGRQVLTANTTFNRTRYNDISLLDNDGYNLAAGWLWTVGSDLSGNLSYSKRRYMRNPRQHTLFSVSNRVGLSETLAGRGGPDAVQRVPALLDLCVMPAGAVPPNPQELLSRPVFSQLLGQLSKDFDVILIDTPAGAEYADAQTIAVRASGALMVARKNVSRASRLRRLADELITASATVVGSVMNEP